MDPSGQTTSAALTGPAAERARIPWSGPERLALMLLALALLSSLPFFVHPWYDPKNDSSMYIAAARAIAAGDGYTYLGQPFHLRPPGFSVLIAPIVGTLGAHHLTLNLYVSLWGAVGVVLFFLWLRPRVGWPLALPASLAIWLNPAYQRFCNQTMADVPGTTLFLACLLLERRAARAPSWKRDLALGVAIGLSTYVRTIHVLLVPAIVVAWALEHRLGGTREERRAPLAARLALVAASAFLVLLPWSVRNHFRAPPPPADQTSLYSYTSAVFHQDKGDPGSPRVPLRELLGRIPERGRDVATGLVRRMQEDAAGPPAALALLVALCWLWVLVKHRVAPEIFVVGALVVLSVYPGFQDRLLVPIYMLLVGNVTETLRDVLRHLARPRVATALVAVALGLLIVLDFAPRRGWERIERAHRRFEDSCSVIRSRVSPSVRLGSGTGWHYNVCLGRSVWGLKHTVARAGDPAAVEQAIDKYRIQVVVLSAPDPEDRSLLPYFERRYAEVERAGELTFVSVRP